MKADIIHGERAFSDLANEWDNLAGRSMTDTPFQSLAYQRAWWQHLGPGTLHTITVREAGALAAVLCVYSQDGLVHFNGCVEETDYLDLIAPAGYAATGWRAAIDLLNSDQFPAWHTLELCNIPAGSPSRAILAEIAAEQGWAHSSDIQEVCPVITLPGDFDTYLESLDKKQRHELRRKLRRASAADVDLHIVRPDEEITQAVDDFLRLLQLSTPEKAAWLNPARRAVFQDVAAAAQAAGTLQLMFLTIEGRKAAALFNLDYKGRVWVYNSGLDPAAFGFLSPGVVLTAQAIEHAINSGHNTFDFLRGSEEYKYRFGAQDTTIHRITLRKAPQE